MAAMSVGGWPCRRLEHILEAAGVAEPEDRRQVEGEHDRLLDRRQFRPQLGDDGAGAREGSVALLVGLETDDEEGLVGRGDAVDEIEADHRKHALHARDRPDDALGLLDDRRGAIDRGAFGQAHGGEQRALILLGQEALRRHA